MQEERNRVSGYSELSFFGKITASVTHEINNVFSIVNEFSGLLEDMAFVCDSEKPVDVEKLKRVSNNIAKQVARGVTTIKRLNRFAHSVDEEIRQFTLEDLLENITSLTQRFANLKKVRLITQFSENPIILISSPFYLQQAIFVCMELVISASEKKGLVTISCENRDPQAKIIISGGHIDKTSEEYNSTLSALSPLLEKLQGKMEPASEKNDRLIIDIPHVIISQ